MPNFNKCILMGNLTRDPKLTYLPNQTPVCAFTLAINRQRKTQAGEKKPEACFIECRLFGQRAETFSQYMHKGSGVLVEGRLKFEQWTGRDGQKRSKYRIIVENFQFMDRAKGSKTQDGEERPGPIESPSETHDEDDIPFRRSPARRGARARAA